MVAVTSGPRAEEKHLVGCGHHFKTDSPRFLKVSFLEGGAGLTMPGCSRSHIPKCTGPRKRPKLNVLGSRLSASFCTPPAPAGEASARGTPAQRPPSRLNRLTLVAGSHPSTSSAPASTHSED